MIWCENPKLWNYVCVGGGGELLQLYSKISLSVFLIVACVTKQTVAVICVKNQIIVEAALLPGIVIVGTVWAAVGLSFGPSLEEEVSSFLSSVPSSPGGVGKAYENNRIWEEKFLRN